MSEKFFDTLDDDPFQITIKDKLWNDLTKRQEIDLLHDRERIPEAKEYIDQQITQNGILNNTIKNAYPSDFLSELKKEDWQKLIKDMNNIPDDWDGEIVPSIITAKEALIKTKGAHLRALEQLIFKAIDGFKTELELTPDQFNVTEEEIKYLTEIGKYKITKKQTMPGMEIKISWE